MILIIKNSGGLLVSPPNTITTPYAFPPSQQADKKLTLGESARAVIFVFVPPPPLRSTSADNLDYAK